MNEKLSMLIGMLLSDGSIFFDRSKKCFCIQFTNKVESLRNIFKDLMKDCFDVKKFVESPCTNAVSVRVFSNKIARFLFKFSPTFRKLPCNSFPKCALHEQHSPPIIDEKGIEWPPCCVPEEIVNNKEFAVPFLRAFASGEGSMFISRKHKVRVLEIGCFHPILKKQLLECFATVGIQARLNKNGVVIRSKSELRKFLDIGGFLPGSVVCNRVSPWLGTPKNQLIEIGLSIH